MNEELFGIPQMCISEYTTQNRIQNADTMKMMLEITVVSVETIHINI